MPEAATSRSSTRWRIAPSRRSLAASWLIATVFFGALLAAARSAEGPLDDPDPALQRPGFLDVGDLPVPAPDIPGTDYGDGRTVVFFTGDRTSATCEALTTASFADDVQIVVATAADAACPAAVRKIADPTLADRFGLRTPRGGGPPVGYAIVDDAGQVRYRTLDPEVASLLDEVRTVLGAV